MKFCLFFWQPLENFLRVPGGIICFFYFIDAQMLKFFPVFEIHVRNMRNLSTAGQGIDMYHSVKEAKKD
ncbi:MAG: hypothetical protein ACOX7X_08030 [Methanosarcina flavescens]|uniref:Uncharacterized protein n=1 Tax=Methanosarcina flavescens TaxID=1715806 RepID=A0A660HNV5_9EURY|nr:MAG: hypothetical protein AAY43_12380 [Methanosarcina sp. 795]AYK13958.1 hypothetical protein AOB57_000900 [Methanosarcina flavescens]